MNGRPRKDFLTKALDEERLEHQDFESVFNLSFSNGAEAKAFARTCLKKRKTRWMLNRVEWFVKLSDEQRYESVRVFFLIAMAETNIKLLESRFDDNKNQMQDVKKFFDRFSKKDKNELQTYFFTTDKFLTKRTLSFTKIVDLLSNVRHRVVHGKDHFHFRFHNGSEGLINRIIGESGSTKVKRKVTYELEATYQGFRKIMIKNAIVNIGKCLQEYGTAPS
jgi:hypothetical protein